MPGSPIRTPWDHSLVDSSPRPIAASHVLHRLLVPRHPPFALDNLTTKMLASTVQFSTNDQPTTRTAPHQTRRSAGGMRGQAMPGRLPKPKTSSQSPKKQPTVVPSGPNRVLCAPSQPHQDQPVPTTPKSSCTRKSRPLPRTNSPVSPPLSTPPPQSGGAGSLHPFR